MSQSIPSLTTYSPQQGHAWGPGFAHTNCPRGGGGGAGFDGSGEAGKILHTGLIRTLNCFSSTHVEYETGTDTVALMTKTFMHLCLF